MQWWYRDHAMNITRWNVRTGLYGTYLVRDAEVYAAWYRFRLVNASNARIHSLVLVDFDAALPTPTAAPAERFDLDTRP